MSEHNAETKSPMLAFKEKLYHEVNVGAKYFAIDIDDVDQRNEAKPSDKHNFVELVLANTANIQELSTDSDQIKRTRKVIALIQSMIDLYIFFSDCFPEQNNKKEKEDEHKRRVNNYLNLLHLREHLNNAYISKLRNYVDSNPDQKFIILIPSYPNISLQSMSILSELRWLRELLTDDKNHQFRENVYIHLFFFNSAFGDILRNIPAEDPRYEYFFDFKSCHFKNSNYFKKSKIRSVLKLNKLRFRSFLVRYLVEYWQWNLNTDDKWLSALKKAPNWLEKHIVVVEDSITPNGEEKNGEEKLFGCSINDLNDSFSDLISDLISGDSFELKIPQDQDKESFLNEIRESCNLSDHVLDQLNGLYLKDDEIKITSSMKNLFSYIHHNIKDGTTIIQVETIRLLILANACLDQLTDDNPSRLIGWDTYISSMDLEVLPIYIYFSTLSKSYNYNITRLFEGFIYNCQNTHGAYTKCYLAHLLEFEFNDLIRLFRFRLSGPQCKECPPDYHSQTRLIKEHHSKPEYEPDGTHHIYCNTNHWIFECLNGWRDHGDAGTLSDYLLLSHEMYYAFEKLFLDIPYTFMLNQRSYQTEIKNGTTNFGDDEFEKLSQSYIEKMECRFESIADSLNKQWEILKGLKNVNGTKTDTKKQQSLSMSEELDSISNDYCLSKYR